MEETWYKTLMSVEERQRHDEGDYSTPQQHRHNSKTNTTVSTGWAKKVHTVFTAITMGCHQGRSQRGDMGECPPRHKLKKNLAPELQTDDCFATGVTRQSLLKPKENVQFQR